MKAQRLDFIWRGLMVRAFCSKGWDISSKTSGLRVESETLNLMQELWHLLKQSHIGLIVAF
jgi:hypothetical protein